MAELQSKKKSFNQAFAEARKRGESKFQWNGAWYSTQTKEEKNVPTKGGISTANYKQKMNNLLAQYTFHEHHQLQKQIEHHFYLTNFLSFQKMLVM